MISQILKKSCDWIQNDSGFNILCKLISYISTDRQAFITVTSLIVFGSVARYIYYYADDVVMESFMFISMYCMKMNGIILQMKES